MFKNVISKDLFVTIFMQLSFGVLGALIVHVIFIRYSPPTIKTVNVSALENSFIQETVKQKLPKAELSKRVSIFARSLNQTINNMAKQKNVIIVPSEAVIAGGVDLTETVANEVKRSVRNDFS